MCLKKQKKTLEFLSPTLKNKKNKNNHESEKTRIDIGKKTTTYNNNF